MKKFPFLVFSLSLILNFYSCSSSEQTTSKTEKQDEDSVYVFDEVPADTTIQKSQDPVKVQPSGDFIIQIGAFTSKDKAAAFAELSRMKLNRDVIIIFSNTVNLFVVQLTEPFATRAEAEKVRNELWNITEFKDAWILTVSK